MLDDKYLQKHKGKLVAIFLMNGVKLEGTLKEYDDYSLTLERDGVEQLMWKHSGATVSPQRPKHKEINYNRQGNK